MILYFSGTGNSEYVAKRIGQQVNDEVMDLFGPIRDRRYDEIHAERPWVVVAPTYAWRLPRIVQTWLENTPLTGNPAIYFVLTCGENIGNAGGYLSQLCDAKGMHYQGCFAVIMPENYVALFSTPTREQALAIIQKAEKTIDEAARLVKSGKMFPQPAVSFVDKRSSGIVNTLFYPLFVHAKAFYATQACTSCGKCAALCPLGNIRLVQGKPTWGTHCTHCMACICRCPSEAIEYGKRSHGKPRYVCPKTL